MSLRRLGPRNPILAAVFWVAVAALVILLLFTAFWYLDRFLPGGGMF